MRFELFNLFSAFFIVGLIVSAVLHYAGKLAAIAVGFVLVVASFAALSAPEPWQLQETRYCGPPDRNADGSIKRSTAVLNAFKRIHPCPSTGATTGACPGWALNHTVPLSCGGCDSVSNLDWMPEEIKSCAEPWCRDRWERKVYDSAPDIADTAACKNQIVTWPK